MPISGIQHSANSGKPCSRSTGGPSAGPAASPLKCRPRTDDVNDSIGPSGLLTARSLARRCGHVDALGDVAEVVLGEGGAEVAFELASLDKFGLVAGGEGEQV